MMKRMTCLLLALVILLCSCGQSDSTAGKENNAPTWQEQYDLGVRYLSEGNYQEAILAFTAAIEIDPKQAPAYVGRGDAYVGSVSGTELTAHTAEFTKVEADYLMAIEIDALSVEVYEKLAELYLTVGDVDSAVAILEQGYQATGDESLNRRRQELGIIATDEVVWTDPAFEQLIRNSIGIPTGPIYVENLDEIISLEVYGDTVAFINETSSDGWGYRQTSDTNGTYILSAYYIDTNSHATNSPPTQYTVRGGITNVDALRYFRNLQYVSIIANHIADVSVLNQLSDLSGACFWANDIEDLSPLERFSADADFNAEQFIEIGDVVMW